jgi:site-specific DNA recombinase
MIAALYARKSTKDEGRGDAKDKSVSAQLDEARAYAAAKGWTVTEAHVYSDDGISGAEFGERRPGLAALLNALQLAPPPFGAVIMTEESRLGREQFQTGYVLAQLATAGVRVFLSGEGREAQLHDSTGKFMESVRGFAAEMEREKARERTARAMYRKARSGFVAGGRVFGYTNVRVDGHVERRINEAEAAVVRRIFTRYAEGAGFRTIEHELNRAAVPCPRPSKGGPAQWSALTIRDMIRRELYQDVQVYGRTQKRNGAGQTRASRRAPEEWVRVDVPGLRIVDEALWEAVQQRRAQASAIYLRHSGGRLWGKPANGVESKYVGTGLVVCGRCGAGLTVTSRSHGRQRAYFYQCRAALARGSACANTFPLPMALTDGALLGYLEGVLLHPDVVAEAVRRALTPDPAAESPETLRARLQGEVTRVERELTAFTQAIAVGGGAIETIVTEMKARERRRSELRTALAALDRATVQPALDPAQLLPRIHAALNDWRGLAARHVQQTRQLLRKLLVGRLRFTPDPATGTVRFQGEGTLGPLVGMLQLPQLPTLVAPTGFEPVFQP